MSTYFRHLRRFFIKAPAGLAPDIARGFTLIELLVVSAIIILITGTILFRQQGFSSATLLRSLSYSIALSVRQAQTYGISVRESATGSGTFAAGYGAYFSNNGCGLGTANRYSLFSDNNANGVYDS